MSASTMAEGLLERLTTIEGINAVLLGDPSTAHEPPVIAVALASIGTRPSNQVTATPYTFAVRLIVRWQENAEAEAELLALAESIPTAIAADRFLGGRLTTGVAQSGPATAGYIVISNTLFRVLEYSVTITEK